MPLSGRSGIFTKPVAHLLVCLGFDITVDEEHHRRNGSREDSQVIDVVGLGLPRSR